MLELLGIIFYGVRLDWVPLYSQFGIAESSER